MSPVSQATMTPASTSPASPQDVGAGDRGVTDYTGAMTPCSSVQTLEQQPFGRPQYTGNADLDSGLALSQSTSSFPAEEGGAPWPPRTDAAFCRDSIVGRFTEN